MSGGFSIGKNLNRGFPGTFAAMPDNIVRSRVVNATSPEIPFGLAVSVKADGTYALFGTGDTATNFAGVAIRTAMQATDYKDQGHAAYAPQQNADVMLRGEISVECRVGTPTVNGKVYVRITENASVPAGVVGGFEAQADGANTIEITNCRWAIGEKDVNNVSALVIMTRNVA